MVRRSPEILRPCRREGCEIALHEEHEQEPRLWFLERAREIRVANLAEKRRLLDAEILEAHDVRPLREQTTFGGEVILTEWRCPRCVGRGWGSRPDVACDVCRGRGVVDRTPGMMVTLLASLGLLDAARRYAHLGAGIVGALTLAPPRGQKHPSAWRGAAARGAAAVPGAPRPRRKRRPARHRAAGARPARHSSGD